MYTYVYVYIYTLIVLSRRIVRGDVSTCQQTQHWWLAVQSHTSVVVSVTPLRHLNSANSHRDGWSSVWILVTAENIHTAGQERRTSPPTSTQGRGYADAEPCPTFMSRTSKGATPFTTWPAGVTSPWQNFSCRILPARHASDSSTA